MKLSVVIPAYNAETTIGKCLSSLINTNMDDIELIVINDGSEDGTEAVVKSFIEKKVKIKLINQENQGAALARKKGIEAAEGEYIGFVDADDWVEPDMFSRMIEEAERDMADIVCCDYYDEEQEHVQSSRNKIVSQREAFFLLNNRKAVFQFLWNKIFKRTLFENIFYPESSMVGEDYTILLQLLRKSQIIGILNYLGYHYSYSENSVGRGKYKKATENGFYNYIKILKYIYKNYSYSYCRSTDNYIINEFLWMIIAMGEGHNYKKKKVKWMRKYIAKRLPVILFNRYNSLMYKMSAVLAIVNYRLLYYLFALYKRYVRKIE